MAIKKKENEDKKESVLDKITKYFKKNNQSANAEDDSDADADDEETESPDADDMTDDEDTSAEDESNDDDQDEDDDDQDEDTTMEVNGQTINLSNREEVQRTIEDLLETNATQASLLRAAAKELKKSTEQVKNEIKSNFVPGGSKRSTKSLKTKADLPAFAKPTEGSIAARVAKHSIYKTKGGGK